MKAKQRSQADRYDLISEHAPDKCAGMASRQNFKTGADRHFVLAKGGSRRKGRVRFTVPEISSTLELFSRDNQVYITNIAASLNKDIAGDSPC